VLGVSDNCIASYPGDFAQALIALGATVETVGPGGGRRIAFDDLHREPGDRPDIQTALRAGELIAFYNVPAGPWTRRSRYVKIRDRDSYQFAITSAAVALDLDGDRVREVRIALGGVASVPWRARSAEQVLKGKPLDEASATEAAVAAFEGAVPRQHNGFKIPLGKQTLVRALLEAKAMRI
jgi:xanthine dehydrogenase YagS FAD-binding subunit